MHLWELDPNTMDWEDEKVGSESHMQKRPMRCNLFHKSITDQWLHRRDAFLAIFINATCLPFSASSFCGTLVTLGLVGLWDRPSMFISQLED